MEILTDFLGLSSAFVSEMIRYSDNETTTE